MESKVCYVDFTEKYQGINTSIRIFENETHLFVYVNQQNPEIRLYNEFMKSIIMRNCRKAKRKKVEVICNLKNYSSIDEIGIDISKIVDGRQK